MISVRVGIYLIDSTRKNLKLPDILMKYCERKSIEFVVIDGEKPLKEQGPFHVIIHKILEWYQYGEETGRKRLMNFIDYIETSPFPIKMIDPIKDILQVADRYYTLTMLKRCEFTMNNISVFVPTTANIGINTDIVSEIRNSDMNFPIIAKSCNSEDHEMSIIFSEENISDIRVPCVIQEFINHSSKLYKVSVINRKFYICERPSVKNLENKNLKTVNFDSMTVSKRNIHNKTLHDIDPLSINYQTCLTSNKPLLDTAVVREIANKIREHLNLTLFGFDIIKDDSTGNYAVIDVNYLPSYDGVSERFAEELSYLLSTFAEGYTPEERRENRLLIPIPDLILASKDGIKAELHI